MCLDLFEVFDSNIDVTSKHHQINKGVVLTCVIKAKLKKSKFALENIIF